MTDRGINASPEARIVALTRRLSEALNEAVLWEAAYYTLANQQRNEPVAKGDKDAT